MTELSKHSVSPPRCDIDLCAGDSEERTVPAAGVVS